MKTLSPRKHEVAFFIADDVAISSFRDEMASMEHPFFALKGGDTNVREYKNGNVTVTVMPNVYGLATVFDKDTRVSQSPKKKYKFKNKKIRVFIFCPVIHALKISIKHSYK